MVFHAGILYRIPKIVGLECRRWALGTLAEITLLSAVYDRANFNAPQPRERIVRLCRDLRDAAGSNPFPVFSTRRQFKRYVDCWYRPEWNDLAAAAVDALSKAEAGAAKAGR
jgi:hypothetical protein